MRLGPLGNPKAALYQFDKYKTFGDCRMIQNFERLDSGRRPETVKTDFDLTLRRGEHEFMCRFCRRIGGSGA